MICVTFASFSNVCFHGVQVIAFFPSSYKAWAARSEKRTICSSAKWITHKIITTALKSAKIRFSVRNTSVMKPERTKTLNISITPGPSPSRGKHRSHWQAMAAMMLSFKYGDGQYSPFLFFTSTPRILVRTLVHIHLFKAPRLLPRGTGKCLVPSGKACR